ncbi:hypothetical protein TYRP_011537 [Tyrophagus putrescentiae]|nr:hypothetical protein TYRP_011537 [Tyrophagus putrescentiae]
MPLLRVALHRSMMLFRSVRSARMRSILSLSWPFSRFTWCSLVCSSAFCALSRPSWALPSLVWTTTSCPLPCLLAAAAGAVDMVLRTYWTVAGAAATLDPAAITLVRYVSWWLIAEKAEREGTASLRFLSEVNFGSAGAGIISFANG